nr:unnamed protein product [Callosobruchus analis]
MPPKRTTRSREEVLERKRIAERLRYQRLKNDPEKRQQMKENERKKYQMKKIKGTRKLVKDMDRREHKAAKRIWKEHCTTYRAKKKSLKDITNNFVRENTPDSLPVSPAPPVSPENVLTVARRQAKLKRERIIREKDRKIYHYKKKMEKYKKRLQRLEKGNSKNNPDTPNTKLQAMCDTPERSC